MAVVFEEVIGMVEPQGRAPVTEPTEEPPEDRSSPVQVLAMMRQARERELRLRAD